MRTRFLLFLCLSLPLALAAQTSLNQTDAKGRKQGQWRKTYADGTLRYEGTFKDDQPEGIFRYYTETGVLRTVMFYYDKGRKSRSKTVNAKGVVLSEGNYSGKEQKDSVWTYYNDSSQVLSREAWQAGKKHGSETVYFPQSGKVLEELQWKNGQKDGPWKQYFESGQVKVQGVYVAGQLQGKVSYFHPNGKPKATGIYQNNVREGTWYYFEETGALKGTEIFKNGVSEKPLLINTDKPEEEIREPLPGQ